MLLKLLHLLFICRTEAYKNTHLLLKGADIPQFPLSLVGVQGA